MSFIISFVVKVDRSIIVKKSMLLLVLMFLPSIALAAPNFYIGSGSVSGGVGISNSLDIDAGTITAIKEKEYIVEGGSGAIFGYTGSSFGIEWRLFEYETYDKAAALSAPLNVIKEQTANLVGRVGNDIFAMRLSIGGGKATTTLVGLPETKRNFDVLTGGVGFDLSLHRSGRIKLVFDFYETRFEDTYYDPEQFGTISSYTQKHTTGFAGMSIKLGEVKKAGGGTKTKTVTTIETSN